MPYNRIDRDDTLRRARVCAASDGRTRFVYLVGGTFTIDFAHAPNDQQYYRIMPWGSITLHDVRLIGPIPVTLHDAPRIAA
jgi:hypothetical protein